MSTTKASRALAARARMTAAGSLAAAGLLAAVVASVSAQDCTFPALCQPGDIVAADLGLEPTTGEVTVAFERNNVLHSRRFDASGTPLGDWKAEIFHPSTAVTVNGRNREVYEASQARGAVNITRHRNDGFKIETWDTGFTGYAGDIEADPWSSEILLARYFEGELQLITLSRDGALLGTWSSGYDEPAPAVDLTTDRVYFLGLGPAEAGGAGGRVARYNDLGERTAEWPVSERPAALALGPDSNLYVGTRTTAAHLGSLVVLSDLGTPRNTWQLGARPVDLEVSAAGVAHVLVLRSYGRALEVLKIGPDGSRTGSWMAWMELQMPYVRGRQSAAD